MSELEFIIIDPVKREIRRMRGTMEDAFADANIKRGNVDFGTLGNLRDLLISIVVFEFGLLQPPDQGHFFSIGEGLFAEGAVIFAADEEGETVSMKGIPDPPVTFYRSHLEVEAAIARCEVKRPQTAVNGKVLWRWGVKS